LVKTTLKLKQEAERCFYRSASLIFLPIGFEYPEIKYFKYALDAQNGLVTGSIPGLVSGNLTLPLYRRSISRSRKMFLFLFFGGVALTTLKKFYIASLCLRDADFIISTVWDETIKGLYLALKVIGFAVVIFRVSWENAVWLAALAQLFGGVVDMLFITKERYE